VNPPRRVRLLVCGNAERADDGAALVAVATLLPTLPPNVLAAVDVRRCDELSIEDFVDVPDGCGCVVVDTVVGIPAGSVVTIPLADLAGHDAGGAPAPRSSHVLPIGHVLGIASVLREGAVEGVFVGVGGRSFGFGGAIGRPVRAALPAFRAAIEQALVDALAPATSRAT
jgi:hydrogenase maturation protease